MKRFGFVLAAVALLGFLAMTDAALVEAFNKGESSQVQQVQVPQQQQTTVSPQCPPSRYYNLRCESILGCRDKRCRKMAICEKRWGRRLPRCYESYKAFMVVCKRKPKATYEGCNRAYRRRFPSCSSSRRTVMRKCMGWPAPFSPADRDAAKVRAEVRRLRAQIKGIRDRVKNAQLARVKLEADAKTRARDEELKTLREQVTSLRAELATRAACANK